MNILVILWLDYYAMINISDPSTYTLANTYIMGYKSSTAQRSHNARVRTHTRTPMIILFAQSN